MKRIRASFYAVNGKSVFILGENISTQGALVGGNTIT